MRINVKQRLESLDILRGFDLFCLVALEGIFHPLARVIDAPWFNSFMWGFTHVDWIGFSTWDLVMPLFMFMSGITIPFALARYKNSKDKFTVYKRIAKRVILLWLFGMICQGNLLALDPDRVYLYSNTLQSIAFGYLIASLLFLHTRAYTQIGIAVIFLLTYWGVMEFVTIDGYGGGNYAPNNNLAEWIDRCVLGRFRDQAYVENGEVIFASWYNYTWILSSLNFAVTTMTGMFAGYILKKDLTEKRKLFLLFAIGLTMVALGWIWGIWHPIIKKLWTSSMTLVSSGYCFLLMGIFYFIIDYCKYNKHTTWLKVYGMNSIVAYMLCCVVNFSSISNSLFFGLKQYIDGYYPVLIATSNALIIYLILYVMYKRNVFLKV